MTRANGRGPGRRRRPALRGPAERNALAAQWAWLPRRVLADLFRRQPGLEAAAGRHGREDLEQEGQLALLRAAELWDPARGTPFPSYAYGCVLGMSLRFLFPSRSEALARGMAALGEAAEPADPSSPAEDLAERGEAQGAVRAALAAVAGEDARGALALALRHGLDGGGERTLAEVGAALGVGRERARVLEARALARLAALLPSPN
jgi:RNA polymerase sigma factor (sigma-70 family)